MAELILDPGYWKDRMERAREPHHAVFQCPLDRWLRIEAKHRQILARTVGDRQSVFDAGCGYGRLLTLMPEAWRGGYLGVDLSPDFVARAEVTNPGRIFSVADLRDLGGFVVGTKFDWAVLISIRPMVRRELGDSTWEQMEDEVRDLANKLLFLEYDEADEGSVE